MEPIPENLRTNLLTYQFDTKDEAAAIWSVISQIEKQQMATVYKKAFGGDPWYEVGVCQECGKFTSSISICQSCSSNSISEAYPTENLIDIYFPEQMLQVYVPGMLSIAKSNSEVVGFTTGGLIELQRLIDKKYVGDLTILNSILDQTQLTPGSLVFYDNETCVNMDYQGKGIGKELGTQRMNTSIQMGAELICGRTVNQPWLGLKRRELTSSGFNFTSFVPEGDTYEINGLDRYFYLAYK